MNNYLLIMDAKRSLEQSNQIEGFLSNHRSFGEWLCPYPGCYLIKSSAANAREIMQTVDGFFNKTGYLIVKVGFHAEDIDGRENSEFWELLYRDLVPEDVAKAALGREAAKFTLDRNA